MATRADVAVIGAGAFGLSVALHCALRGRSVVVVDRATGATSVPRLYAGGDCIRGGGEIVDAVQDGKVAARGIDAALRAGDNGHA